MEIFLISGYSAGQDPGELGSAGGLEPAAAGGGQFRLVHFQPLCDGDEGPDKHAGIPAVLAAIEVFQGLVELGFLDKLFRFEEGRFVGLDSLRRGQDVADADVTITGGRLGGLDADGDNDLAAPGQIKGIGQHLLEFFLLGDDLVGGQDGHDGAGGALPGNGGAEGDGGAGVAADWLGDHVFPGELGQLAVDFRRLEGVGDDEDVLERDERQDALNGLLQKGTAAQETDQLLGGFFAADGPEPLAAPACHDDDKTIVAG